MLALPEKLARLSQEEAEALACRDHLGVWTQRRRKLEMSALHWEWCELRMFAKRLAVVAPREHSKSETFTVNGTAWESVKVPGLWTVVFCQSGDQAKEMLGRIKTAIGESEPWMVEQAVTENSSDIVFANYARVTVAGAGKAVRGWHPDVVVGDDVLEEGNCLTSLQRKRIERWWFGTVGGMSHPGTYRTIGRGKYAHKVWMQPTRVFLVGTPFHQQDLLMNMRTNPMYQFRRYAAEFRPDELVPGSMAVEIT